MSHPHIFFIYFNESSAHMTKESSVYFYESSAHVFFVCVCVRVRVCVCRCAYRCMRMCVCVYWNLPSHQMTRVIWWLIRTYFAGVLRNLPSHRMTRMSHPYIFMSHPHIFFIEIYRVIGWLESSDDSSAHIFMCVCVCVRACVCRCAYRCMCMCVCVYWNILSHQMTRVVRWLICTYLYV